MQNTHHIQHQGFTLVETLVAIAVLLLIIIGPMTVAQKGIQNSYYANEQVTAVFLAQEAIEAVRELRDSVALEAFKVSPGVIETWDWISTISGTNDCIGVGNECGFKRGSTNPIVPCSDGSMSDCLIREDSVTYVYTHNSSDNSTPFTRKITFTPLGNTGVQVTVEVSWRAKAFGNAIRTVRLQTYLYDYYQRHEDTP